MSEVSESRWTFRGLVEAPVEQVWEALLSVSPLLAHVDHDSLEQAADHQQHLTTMLGESPTARIRVDIDRRQRELATEGEWWYRGVYAVKPHEQGSLLTYRVYNIAPRGSRWLVPLVTRNYRPTVTASFRDLLSAISARLHAPAVLASD